MCMLTFFPAGVYPEMEALEVGAMVNNDGHGFAIVTGDRIIIHHGMNADVVLERFERTREEHPGGPALFHSRLGTGGVRDRRNCHPFRIKGDRRTVLAHNGVLPMEADPPKGDDRCDTRYLAEEVIRSGAFGRLHTEGGRRAVEKWMGTRNKIVILTTNPAYGEPAFILNETQGQWDGGIWYSNRDYLNYRYVLGVDDDTATGDGDTSPHLMCPVCFEVGHVNTFSGYCTLCGGCADCGRPNWLCDCYTPARGYPDSQWVDDILTA